MEKNTKDRILEEALKLFSQNSYLGTSMNDIANQLGITKGALYRHYIGKQELLDSIIAKMSRQDTENAKAHEMPQNTTEEMTSAKNIAEYAKAQFRYWTQEEFPSQFRRMLTLEQYRDPEMARLYHNYIAAGPLQYMADIFGSMMGKNEADAMQMALGFYGPMFLLYSVYDVSEDKQSVTQMLDRHVEKFFEKLGEKNDE